MNVRNFSLRCAASLRYLARRRAIPVAVAGELTPRPVFILGSGRSGNTLLRRGLVEHSTLVVPPETYVLGDIILFFYRHNSIGWDGIVKYALSTFSFHPEFEETFKIRLDQLYYDLMQVPTRDRSLRRLLDSFYRFYAQSQGNNTANLDSFRWGDKTPFNTYAVWHLSKVFPSACFIGMYRDPVDVVASYLKAGIYSSVEKASLRWLESNQILLEYQRTHSERCQFVCYEGLVRNYEPTIQEVCHFCDLAYNADAVSQALGDVAVHKHHANVLGPISSASIGKGRMALNAKEVELVERITADCYSNLLAL